jgi:hypothetical protein
MDFPTNDHKLSEFSNNRFDLLRWSHVFINNVLSDWPVFLIDCKFSENLITKVEIGNQERGKKILRKTNYEDCSNSGLFLSVCLTENHAKSKKM